MQNLGYITDCIFHRLNGVIENKGEYTVIRTPSNPTYYWGNLLHFEKAPTGDCFEIWLEYFRMEFGEDGEDGEDGEHITFAWDEEAKGEIDQFLSAGFEWDETLVLRLDEPKWDFRVNDQVEVRPISTDAEWRAVINLQIQMSDQEKTPGFIEFKEKAFVSMRNIQDRGHGSWWGAFIQDQLIADMGLFFDFDKKLGRFQSVETHPDFQNRGICKTLLKAVMRDAIEDKGIRDLVIVTESDNHARHVYRTCGFIDHSKQSGLCHSKPYWKKQN